MADQTFPEIERRVAENRAALAQSLDVLSNTLAPERLKQEASETVNRYGSEIGQQLWEGARGNPAAFSLLAAGIALLLTNAGKRTEADAAQADPDPRTRTGLDAAGRDAQIKQIKQPAPRHVAMQSQKPSASKLRKALHLGVEKLPPNARIRVIKAREAAISAQHALERRAVRAGRASGRLAKEQPVVLSAAAFGVGALLATLLPSTRAEDEILGAKRDELMDAAQAALQEELSKLKPVAGSAAQPARPI